MTFRCFGATCAVLVDDGKAAAAARRQLEAWHQQFSRFLPASELTRLNADARPAVPVSPTMARRVEAVVEAARMTGGLVDATLLHALEAAGYRTDLRASLPLRLALRLAPPRRPAGPSPARRWAEVRVVDGVVHRPPGVAIDSGGLGKGLFADLIAESLPCDVAAVDCAGDLRIRGPRRTVRVADPFGGGPVHAFAIADGAVATSGIGRRSWLDARGRPAHHLLDPATGRPAFTGLVQVTALAPTALEAEIRAKAALLSGPEGAREWLPDGGVLVADDGGFALVEAATPSERPAPGAARPSHAPQGPPCAPSAGRAPAAAAAAPR
jgi:FAD:protein FMN transferase